MRGGKISTWPEGVHRPRLDDLCASRAEQMAELAGILDAWPARTLTARRALDRIADELEQLASQTSPV